MSACTFVYFIVRVQKQKRSGWSEKRQIGGVITDKWRSFLYNVSLVNRHFCFTGYYKKRDLSVIDPQNWCTFSIYLHTSAGKTVLIYSFVNILSSLHLEMDIKAILNNHNPPGPPREIRIGAYALNTSENFK